MDLSRHPRSTRYNTSAMAHPALTVLMGRRVHRGLLEPTGLMVRTEPTGLMVRTELTVLQELMGLMALTA